MVSFGRDFLLKTIIIEIQRNGNFFTNRNRNDVHPNFDVFLSEKPTTFVCVSKCLSFNDNLFVSTYNFLVHTRKRCKQHHVFSNFFCLRSLFLYLGVSSKFIHLSRRWRISHLSPILDIFIFCTSPFNVCISFACIQMSFIFQKKKMKLGYHHFIFTVFFSS